MIFLVILHVFVSFVLIFVILLQAGKGGGLSEEFGGASQQLFGTKSSTFLNRATSVCAILFLCTCLGIGILSSHSRSSLMERASHPVHSLPVKKENSQPPVAAVKTEPAKVGAPKNGPQSPPPATQPSVPPAGGSAQKSEKSP